MFVLLPKGQRRLSKSIWLLFGFVALVVCTLSVCRLCGLYRMLYMPSGSMTPTINPGDHLVMDGVTYLTRRPRRGELVVFKTGGITGLPPDEIYVKRIVGEPGEKLRIVEGQLYINDKAVTLSNAAGRIVYKLPPGMAGSMSMLGTNTIVVPDGCYFVIGDNSAGSLDSRSYGSVPRENIIGRIWFCYLPSQRSGIVK